MNDTNLRVKIMDPKAYVNEHFPYEIVNKLLSVLFSYVSGQVAMLTVFHDDVYLSVIDERVMITHYKMRIKFSKKLDLLHSFESCMRWQISCIYFFNHVVSILFKCSFPL